MALISLPLILYIVIALISISTVKPEGCLRCLSDMKGCFILFPSGPGLWVPLVIYVCHRHPGTQSILGKQQVLKHPGGPGLFWGHWEVREAPVGEARG